MLLFGGRKIDKVMAHKKGVGSTDNGRDSNSKRLGVKIFGGQTAKAGNIIVRQRGTKFHAGDNTYLGKDFTIHAAVDGKVVFKKRRLNRTYISILPELQEVAETKAEMPAAKAEPVVVEAPAVEEAVTETVAPVTETVEATPAAEVQEEVATVEVEQVSESAAVSTDEVVEEDDLTKIEGIGPKISSLLKAAGIKTFAQLSVTEADKIREILLEAGNRYKAHDPTTWPKQAAMANAGNWDELQAYQDILDGGKEPTE